MKNIFAIMQEQGIDISEDKKKDFEKAVLENYKTIADYDKQKGKLDAAEAKLADTEKTLGTVQETIKTYEGADVTALNKTIEDLKAENQKKDNDYQQQLADRDFTDLLKESIQSAKGLNHKSIIANLDVDVLKASKNQKEDISAALKALSESDDCKMLFGQDAPQTVGKMNIISGMQPQGNDIVSNTVLRTAMGLPPIQPNNTTTK